MRKTRKQIAKKWIGIVTVFLVVCLLMRLGIFAPRIDVIAENVNTIEVVTGGVPAAAEQKIINKGKDIDRVCTLLNKLVLTRRLFPWEQNYGGIGMIYTINYNDGSKIVVSVSNDKVSYRGSEYRAKNTHTQDIWDSLDYPKKIIGEEGIPNY